MLLQALQVVDKATCGEHHCAPGPNQATPGADPLLQCGTASDGTFGARAVQRPVRIDHAIQPPVLGDGAVGQPVHFHADHRTVAVDYQTPGWCMGDQVHATAQRGLAQSGVVDVPGE
ncbi:hypothetical protein D9M68_718740 [compost metagenome]